MRAVPREIPQRDVDGGERVRTDTAGRQRADVRAQTRRQRADLTRVFADDLWEQIVRDQRGDGRAAGADRVPEADAAAAGDVHDFDDRQLERVEFLDRVAARRIDGHARQPNLRADERVWIHRQSSL